MNKESINRLFEFTYQKHIKDIDLEPILNGDRAYISKIKSGKKRLTFQKLELVYNHFQDLDLNWLFRGKPLGKGKGQTITGSYNTQAGMNITGEPSHLEMENRHLKQLIKEKDKQIELLEKLVK